MHQPCVTQRRSIAPIDIGMLLGRVRHADQQVLMQLRQPLQHHLRIGRAIGAGPASDDGLDFPLHPGRADTAPGQIGQPRHGAFDRVGSPPIAAHGPASFMLL